MRKPRILDFSADDVRRLDEILNSLPAHLTPTKLRQLRVAKALCLGVVDSDIAAQERITKQRVSDIRKQIAEQTLATFLNCLLKKRDSVEKKPLRPHAGRPGHEDIDAWSAAIKIDDEPIFELATLLITPELQVASIAIREGCIHKKKKKKKSSDDPEEEKQEVQRNEDKAEARLRALLRHHSWQMESAIEEPIFWTEMLNIDSILSETFLNLQTGFEKMLQFCSGSTAAPANLRERYDERFGHVIICRGPEDLSKQVVDRLTCGAICRLITVDPDVDFLEYLEAILFQRRSRSSSVGFMPLVWTFYDEVNHWIQSGCDKSFHWHVKQSEVVQFLKYPLAVRDYFAIQGVLFEIDSSLWKKIAHQDEIPFHILPLETRVEVAEYLPHEDVVNLWIRPLPEIQYSISVSWSGTPEEAAKIQRQKMRSRPEAKRLVYTSLRHSDQFRPTIVLPATFFETADPSKRSQGSGVVLLPRHFLTPFPNLPLEALAGVELIKAEPISFLTVVSDAVDDTFLLFFLPSILQGIRRAFEENWYGDKVRHLSNWQGQLMPLRLPSSPGADRLEFQLFQCFYKFGPDAPTFYFFRKENYEQMSIPPEVSARVEDILRMRDESVEHNCERDFENLLKNVDADFLLSGVGDEDREIFDEAAENWAHAIDSIIASVYWPLGKLDEELVKSMLGGQRQDFVAQHIGDIEDWCSEARIAFLRGKKLVLRAAIENMQRLVLSGLPPCPVAVESEESIFRRWRKMLRRTLNVRLAAAIPKGRRAVSPSGKKNKSIRLDADANSDALNTARESKSNIADETADAADGGTILDDDIDAICDLVRFLDFSAEEKKLQQFFELARDIPEFDVWLGVLYELNKEQPTAGWQQRLCDALALCRNAQCASGSALPKSLVDKLKRIFTHD